MNTTDTTNASATTTQHTPGPWRVEINHSDETDGAFYVRAGAFNLCKLDTNDSVQDEANAKLIAAAPELLRALTLLHELACKSGLRDETIAIAYDAIAKASN